MRLADTHLEDKYHFDKNRIYVNGMQALVRLCLLQSRRDRAAGLNTAGFVSGYRGSPLGGIDTAFWQAKSFLEEAHIHFQPGLNEDLAATSLWGTQQTGLFPGPRVDGVFGMWYGKGPGVDRCGDVFKHANAAGTAALGGILAVAGDDHTCKSSTLPHQCEYSFIDANIPVLNPSSLQEVLDYGLTGWAMSRYSGCWVGLKTTSEIMDTSASVSYDSSRLQRQIPEELVLPEDGLNIRWPDLPLSQEYRLHHLKLQAVRAFAVANELDRVVWQSPQPHLGIVTTGKSYLDVLQALHELGLSGQQAATIGISLYKVGLSWPLEAQGIRHFARNVPLLLVVEEKRGVIEPQIKDHLYHCPASERPVIIGKQDEHGARLLPSSGELSPTQIALVLGHRILQFYPNPELRHRLQTLERLLKKPRTAVLDRVPYFCAGCPHNTSTRVPENSLALAGIGCHYMAIWMNRQTRTFTHMGAEGASWIGLSCFTATRHVFVNIGDGTYLHSGILAIRAAVAAGVNITYKILYNSAVAMTGGQPVDDIPVAAVSYQLLAEGVKKVLLVTDEPSRYGKDAGLAPGVTVHNRTALPALQKQLRDIPGVTAIIYEQMCATEKRRQRKRGQLPDPTCFLFINQEVCEGCGDCSTVSNCMAIVPDETVLGRKRRIDQSACNKDYSCLEGFCPSIVSVENVHLRTPEPVQVKMPEALPEPVLPDFEGSWNILVAGIGGTGVVTLGALLGMAAHLEGQACTVLDMTGLAQKFGAVSSHVRINKPQDDALAARIPLAGTDLLLGADITVASGADALSRLATERSGAVINDEPNMPSSFIPQPDLYFPGQKMQQVLRTAAKDCHFLPATKLAEGLLGHAIYANLLLLGYAWQLGKLPLKSTSLLRAIELNGTAIEKNKQAFHWGRKAALDLQAVSHTAGLVTGEHPKQEAQQVLQNLIKDRVQRLTQYQNRRFANHYQQTVDTLCACEQAHVPGATSLGIAFADQYYHLLAHKDEYEVARLFISHTFHAALSKTFTGKAHLRVHLAVPLLNTNQHNRPLKRGYGSWIIPLFHVLAWLRPLRGTWLDPFRYTAERKFHNTQLREFTALFKTVQDRLSPTNHALAVDLFSLQRQARGFGPVKRENAKRVHEQREILLQQFLT